MLVAERKNEGRAEIGGVGPGRNSLLPTRCLWGVRYSHIGSVRAGLGTSASLHRGGTARASDSEEEERGAGAGGTSTGARIANRYPACPLWGYTCFNVVSTEHVPLSYKPHAIVLETCCAVSETETGGVRTGCRTCGGGVSC
eukprot:3181107-Rhodomonas_salina.3